MKDYEYRRYKRIHNYSHPSDVEEGKIKKEITGYKKNKNKSKKIVSKIGDELDLESLEELAELAEEYEYAAKKEIRNAKTHKNRLKKLKKNKDFY